MIKSFVNPPKSTTARGQSAESKGMTSLIQQRASSMSTLNNKQLIINNMAIKKLAEEADQEIRKKHASGRTSPNPNSSIVLEDKLTPRDRFNTIPS